MGISFLQRCDGLEGMMPPSLGLPVYPWLGCIGEEAGKPDFLGEKKRLWGEMGKAKPWEIQAIVCFLIKNPKAKQ